MVSPGYIDAAETLYAHEGFDFDQIGGDINGGILREERGRDGAIYLIFDDKLRDPAAIRVIDGKIIDDRETIDRLLNEGYVSLIRTWRERAMLTQTQMASLFEIPLRTLQNWEFGSREPAPWAEKLIIEKLIRITEKVYMDKTNFLMKDLEDDANGRRPEAGWFLLVYGDVDKDAVDDFHFENMQSAIEFAEGRQAAEKEFGFHGGTYWIGYVICNRDDEDELQPSYVDKNGKKFSDCLGFYI